MTDLNPQTDPGETPEDVATLYSWANLHGAKYRDFSAARAQTRELARQRAEQSAQEQLELKQSEAEASQQAEAEEARASEEAQAAEETRQADLLAEQEAQQEVAEQAEREAQELAAQQAARLEAEETSRRLEHEAAELAARQAEEQAAIQAEQEAARIAAQKAAMDAAERESQRAQELAAQKAAQEAAQLAARKAAERAAEQAAQQLAQQRAWQQPSYSPPLVNPPSPPYAQPHGYEPPAYVAPPAFRPGQNQQHAQPQYAQPREENARDPWAASEAREPSGRPAWLSPEPTEPPAEPAPFVPFPAAPSVPQTTSSLPQAPEDTLQGSRDRLTSRWFALRGVFDGATPAAMEAVPPPIASPAPALAVFSLAGGVGKTSLVATLGRALSARGERVLLVDTAAFGLLPFFFGATDQRPGVLRTFSPPGVSSDAPIQIVTIDPDSPASEQASQDGLSGEIVKFARGASRILVDLATASGATTRRIMRMSPLVLVPVIPDMNSVVSVSSIDAFFEHHGNQAGRPTLPFYVLNQFDASLPLHLDVREVLREQLSERLLPFALRRTPAMSEALAEGMTVMDYAPGSMLAEDFNTLAGWVKSLSAPATTSYRGVRWSER